MKKLFLLFTVLAISVITFGQAGVSKTVYVATTTAPFKKVIYANDLVLCGSNSTLYRMTVGASASAHLSTYTGAGTAVAVATIAASPTVTTLTATTGNFTNATVTTTLTLPGATTVTRTTGNVNSATLSHSATITDTAFITTNAVSGNSTTGGTSAVTGMSAANGGFKTTAYQRVDSAATNLSITAGKQFIGYNTHATGGTDTINLANMVVGEVMKVVKLGSKGAGGGMKLVVRATASGLLATYTYFYPTTNTTVATGVTTVDITTAAPSKTFYKMDATHFWVY